MKWFHVALALCCAAACAWHLGDWPTGWLVYGIFATLYNLGVAGFTSAEEKWS